MSGTGWALFRSNKQSLYPEKTGVLTCKAGGSWPDRQSELVEKMDDLCVALEFDRNVSIAGEAKGTRNRAYIELPTFFQSSKGMTCATGSKGDDSDLVKLACLVGRFYEVFYENNVECILVPVNQWKGTLPKNVVASRVSRRLGCAPNAFGNHEMDAVGIGLWIKGNFKANEGRKPNVKRR